MIDLRGNVNETTPVMDVSDNKSNVVQINAIY